MRRVLLCVSLVCWLVAGLSSCVVKRRLITRKGSSHAQPTLLVATQTDLAGLLQEQYSVIQNLNATVDMTPALGTTEKNHVTEYKDVRGYILFKKPDDIRIIGLYPVLRNTAFDMVSMGDMFRLYLPSKNQFLVGSNEVEAPSPNKIENLRPQHFLEALFVAPAGPPERMMLENFTDEDNAFYILHAVQEGEGGTLHLRRTIWFNRVDLRLARQMIFDIEGNVLTDARYSEWQQFDGVPFAKHIEIDRPQDEYAVVLDVVKMDINKGVSDDKFVLTQPPGSALRTVGHGPGAALPSRRSPSQGLLR